MNIDRHNYEMYFLLYVDNELSLMERTAVELYVAENIDLKHELELLMQTALPSEEITFSSKHDLYKIESDAPSLYDQMLLHLDNELEPKFIESLTLAMASDVNLRKEWNILQQTKLDENEKVIFEDKKILYRHEKGKLISMRLWRSAAAILLVGLSIFIGVSKFPNNNNPDVASNSGKNINQIKKGNLPDNKYTSTNKDVTGEQKNEMVLSNDAVVKPSLNKEENSSYQAPENNGPKVISSKTYNTEKTDGMNISGKKSNNDNKSLVQKETNNLPKPYFENLNTPNSNKTSSPIVKDNMDALKNKKEEFANLENAVAENKLKGSLTPNEEISLTETRNVYAKNALLNASSAENENNSVLFLHEEKLNRTKISGLFRKVKRVLTRNANIETGNSVKIAGFEIATK